MTEDEAKTKWCPFARVVTIHPEAGVFMGPANRNETCGEDHFTKPMGSFCIGSACMAWRWEYNPLDSQRTSHGFCGLSGRPT